MGQLERDVYVKFDVYINMLEYEKVRSGKGEFAGRFMNVLQMHKREVAEDNIIVGLD